LDSPPIPSEKLVVKKCPNEFFISKRNQIIGSVAARRLFDSLKELLLSTSKVY
jgi:hypothetical protein